ncbi:MAG: metalloregulator ArsR/SmtB family transcription factor [Christensenella sp.]|nr:metalloregulator ArsR/SmtB family transcription factor [Christensenella sp.]
MNASYEQNAKVFKAFCDENRLRVLERLRGGEQCACALIESLGIGQSALSYHMKILIESGVVSTRQEGKWTHYSISESGSARARELLDEITTPDDEEQANACICK